MVFDQFKQQLPDIDEQETQEWIESLDSVVETSGPGRAQFLLYKILKRARMLNVGLPPIVQTRYINTISPEQEPPFPGDEDLERRIRRLIRWNAAVMVTRANKRNPGIGGHISSYASSASLYEVGLNHFFRGKDGDSVGDQVFFQGHAAPGMYARAYLEGRLSEDQLEHFRREARGKGLPSYPHPRLMPDFWEYPTVSMGLGPMAAIYQARFNRYLHNRGICDTSQSRVWAFVGDGESDEPESLAALTLAAREGLDNLIFVVNCNLQRLDGPVRGNGKIIQELESVFRGAGWNVIKVLWSRKWDPLLLADVDGLLVDKMMETLDGDYQRFATSPGSVIREEFFGPDPRLRALVEHLSDDDLKKLRWGGHDYRRLHAAYKLAVEHSGQPSVILAKTVKGWTLGEGFEARNVTHQMKKLDEDELALFRDLLQLPIPDEKLKDAPYYHPGENSEEVQYMLERRRRLGGCLPKRRVQPVEIQLPGDQVYGDLRKGTGAKVPASTTMAFVRMLRALLKTKEIGPRIVPIIPDEARTFGMESLFREFKIYAALGQRYTPVDAGVLLSYTEGVDGQLLEEGITEAGSMASFQASGTSYATHRQPTIPFFIFYSMFGFQRVGDAIWAFADARGRGFLMGATAGRTTLNGEGLQHEDGHSHMIAATVPACLPYDPAFAYEISVIVEDGLRRMYEDGEDIFYYISIYNENYEQPPMVEGSSEGILKGLYLYRAAAAVEGPGKGSGKGKKGSSRPRVQLLGSGAIVLQVLRAQEVLATTYGVDADVFSATSFTMLRREALGCERWNRLHPDMPPRIPYVTKLLSQGHSSAPPVIAASDWMKAFPDQLGRWIPGKFTPLGTDGFGRSDTREELRRFFEMDAEHIVVAALSALVRGGELDAKVLDEAVQTFGVDVDAGDPAAY